MNDITNEEQDKKKIVVDIFEKTNVKVSIDDPIVILLNDLTKSLNGNLGHFKEQLEHDLFEILRSSVDSYKSEHEAMIEHYNSSIDLLIMNGSGILGDIEKLVESIKSKETEIAQEAYILARKQITQDVREILDKELQQMTKAVVQGQLNHVNKQRNMLIGGVLGAGVGILIAFLFLMLTK